LTCELTSLARFHGQVAAAIIKEETAGPAAVVCALTCCNVDAALAAIATASAEQISGRRPDKFHHGPRENRFPLRRRMDARLDTWRDRRPGSGHLADQLYLTALAAQSGCRSARRPPASTRAVGQSASPPRAARSRAMASQTVSSHRTVTVVRGCRTMLNRKSVLSGACGSTRRSAAEPGSFAVVWLCRWERLPRGVSGRLLEGDFQPGQAFQFGDELAFAPERGQVVMPVGAEVGEAGAGVG
jgi:hypothetical protein